MALENLIKYEKPVYALTKFKGDPKLSLDTMLSFLREGSNGSEIALEEYWDGVEAESLSELKRYGTFRGGVAQAMQLYASKWDEEFNKSDVPTLVEYSGIKLNNEEKEQIKNNKYASRTYEELEKLSQDEKKLSELNENDRNELIVMVNYANISRKYRFNEIEYSVTKNDLTKTARELLKATKKKEEKKDKE